MSESLKMYRVQCSMNVEYLAVCTMRTVVCWPLNKREREIQKFKNRRLGLDHDTPYPRSTKRTKRGYRNVDSENQKMHMNWWKEEDGRKEGEGGYVKRTA